MDGVLVIDKPSGLTSHDVVAVARRQLGERSVGHTGTLDPLATGVLPLACGRATRLIRFMPSDKDYGAGIRFGVSTDSFDITGAEVTRSGLIPTREAVETALESLRGEYLQMPPDFSAKKVAGRRAYALARQSEEVTLRAVPVRVARAELLDFTGGLAQVAITSSSGFYVRSFAHTLGQLVGTGACLESLRRTRSGEFDLGSAVALDALSAGPPGVADQWIPCDRLLGGLPFARLTGEGRDRVSHGRSVSADHVLPVPSGGLDTGPSGAEAPALQVEAPHAWIRLLDEDGRLIGVATAGHTPGLLRPTVVLT